MVIRAHRPGSSIAKFNTRTFNSQGDVVLRNVLKNLDLNAATEQQLAVIFGKDHAKQIMDYRTQNGPFESWEDLKRIPRNRWTHAGHSEASWMHSWRESGLSQGPPH